MASSQDHSIISVEYKGRYAVITIDNPAKLNAMGGADYFELSQALRQIDTHDEVFVTVILAKGRFFSAGADVSISRAAPAEADENTTYRFWLSNFVANNLNVTDAFSKHSKILVIGLNGPVVGLSAALVSFGDFIYAAPHTFLLTPFSSIGLVTEGGASRALVQRLGPAKSMEALVMSKRIYAPELERAGYVNAIFDEGDDVKFNARVLKEVDDRLGDHLNGDSLTGIKKLIRGPEREIIDNQNVKEVFAGLQRFLKGIPQEEFRKLATGEKRHKL